MKKEVLSGLMLIALTTTLAVIALIGFSIYHQNTTSTISEKTASKIIPITPVFNLKAVESVNKREKIQADLQEEVILVTITPTPSKAVSKTGRTTSVSITPTLRQ